MPTRKKVMLKFRVIVKHPMPKSEAWKKLKKAIRTGWCPDDIKIMAMDWRSGKGRRITAGVISPDDCDEMREFWNLIRQSEVRAEKC